MIRSWLARKVLEAQFAQLNRGDYAGLMRMYADDVHFVFPGNNRWSCDVRGKEAVGDWLRELVTIGITFELEDVVVSGPLWNSAIVLRSTDTLVKNGETIYHNRYVIWAKTRWLKIYDYEVYEDTEKATELADRLTAAENQNVR